MTDKKDHANAATTHGFLPLRQGVLLPGTVATIPVGRKRSLALFEHAQAGDEIVVGVQRQGDIRDPARADLYDVAVLARIHRIRRLDDGSVRVVMEGLERRQLLDVVSSDPHLKVSVAEAQEVGGASMEARVLAESLREHVAELAGESGGAVAQALEMGGGSGLLADRIASGLPLEADRELRVLMTLDVVERLRLVADLVNEVRELSGMKERIDDEVRRRLSKGQREAILRERIKAMQGQLGEGDEGKGELDELANKLEGIELPEEVAKTVHRELKRARSLNTAHPEFSVARTYLETIAELPWDKRAEVEVDIDRIQTQLDADHHGLDDVKERILQHMAVLKLSGNTKGTILCLAGPPGVGKTSLGQSIADATGRPFVRIALGGVRDEAEIRGHRRTYVGAIPGRILSALRKSGVKNPVMLLDEVDKLGAHWRGSPEDALLELLDPEQNHTFTDHYLELPFDLSEVMFVATANDLSRMSAPLRDRLEIIELGGYTPEEKKVIARQHLIPRKLEEHALEADAFRIDDEALTQLVVRYTREAGVRQLAREIGKLCRGVALEIARSTEAKLPTVHLGLDELDEYLGKQRFFNDVAERTQSPGVATGLAWTPVGGDILFIETSRMPGKGTLQTTGQLGDVMKESARAAMTYVRSNAEVLGVDPDFLEKSDIHIHVPAGGVPKDGPSAGVTIFTALTSLLTGRRVRADTAMTGEATLRGRVLPVGGIKAKVLAAHRAGLRRVILPERNLRDLDDIPDEVRGSMEFFPVRDMSEVLALALEEEGEDEELELPFGTSAEDSLPNAPTLQ